MVWTPHEGHQRPQPTLHFPVRESLNKLTGNPTKLIISIPSPNIWTIGEKEPMDQTISMPNHPSTARRLDGMALHCISSPQQPTKHHYWTITQSNLVGVQNQTCSIRTKYIKQSNRRRPYETNDGKMSPGYRRIKQVSPSVSATITVPSRGQSLVRSIKSMIPTPN
jgi:hypothetical protein